MPRSFYYVGDEVEIHYGWHPYHGQKVCIRRAEQRATGLSLKVLGPAGVVVLISGWMIDPVVCGGMTMGLARVDLATLVELNRLVTSADKPALFRGGRRITHEEDDEIPQYAGATSGRQLDLIFKPRTLDGLSDKDGKKAVSTLPRLSARMARSPIS